MKDSVRRNSRIQIALEYEVSLEDTKAVYKWMLAECGQREDTQLTTLAEEAEDHFQYVQPNDEEFWFELAFIAYQVAYDESPY